MKGENGMVKRLIVFLLVAFLLVTVFAGCAAGKETEGSKEPAGEESSAKTTNETKNTTEEKSKDEKVTIKLMQYTSFGGQEKTLDAMLQEFMKRNPNIKVKYEVVGWRNYYQKLNMVRNSPNGPDVFELGYENFMQYAPYEGVLTDLTDIIKNDKDFKPEIFKKLAFDAFNIDGKQLGVCSNFSNVILYYNKDLFDANNVKYPDASWTWKDELEAAKKITDPAKGILGTHAPIQFYEFYKTIAQNGGSIWSKDNKSVTINSKECVEALQWMLDKGYKYKVDALPNDETWDQADHDLSQFVAGKLGMMRAGVWSLGRITESAKFNWDIALEPGNTQKAHHVFVDGLAVAGSTKYPEAAWKLVKFLSSDPFVVKMKVEKGWGLSAVNDPESMAAFLKATPPSSKQVVIDALDYPVLPPVGPIPQRWNEFTALVGAELTNAKLGKKDAQTALNDAKTGIEELLKEE